MVRKKKAGPIKAATPAGKAGEAAQGETKGQTNNSTPPAQYQVYKITCHACGYEYSGLASTLFYLAGCVRCGTRLPIERMRPPE